MGQREELAELETARSAWVESYREPRDLRCPKCDDILGTLFFITWGEQPLMDAVADASLGGVPTQGFYVLTPQETGALVPLKGRRRYARGPRPEQPLPPAWVGLPGEITCAACGTLAQIPHPRFPQQARLDALLKVVRKDERRRWRR
jgi:hypothetical protein